MSFGPKIPFGSFDNQCTIVVNVHQDSAANMHSDLFLEQTDSGLKYYPNHSDSPEPGCPNKNKKNYLNLLM
jgi:hypothetical protein